MTFKTFEVRYATTLSSHNTTKVMSTDELQAKKSVESHTEVIKVVSCIVID